MKLLRGGVTAGHDAESRNTAGQGLAILVEVVNLDRNRTTGGQDHTLGIQVPSQKVIGDYLCTWRAEEPPEKVMWIPRG